MSFNQVWIASLLVVIIGVCSAHFTHLEIDNHPCKPENLKSNKRYICDRHGTVHCLSGWKQPDVFEPLHELNPCLEPICDFDDQGCKHGECRAPNFCACKVGWEGYRCEKCVPLPGCVNGNCSTAFECNCHAGWAGYKCDIAVCDNCVNGQCIEPDNCLCDNGWSNKNCTTCQKMAGCVHGHCSNHPFTCECENGWEGPLCDTPSCFPPCEHGYCHAVNHGNGNFENICICHSGWRGDHCENCSPYWNCPNNGTDACIFPNQCFCSVAQAVIDPEQLCNNTRINGDDHDHDSDDHHHHNNNNNEIHHSGPFETQVFHAGDGNQKDLKSAHLQGQLVQFDKGEDYELEIVEK